MPSNVQVARTFYLNERHELSRQEKEGGGGAPKLAPLDWGTKGQTLRASLADAIASLIQLDDPAKDRHYYLFARPDATVLKFSDDKTRTSSGFLTETVDYSGKDSRVFSRLGADLLSVAPDGGAVVHLTPERAEQLQITASNLAENGIREQARWVTVQSFDSIPLSFRVDEDWIASIPKAGLADSIIEYQPLLGRSEVDAITRIISALVHTNAPRGQLIKGNGSDYSGKHWLRASLSSDAIRQIASRLASVQALHTPLISRTSGSLPYAVNSPYSPPTTVPTTSLPTVGIVDTGIPTNHATLAIARRPGGYAATHNAGGTGDHGSFVASRAVFGDFPSGPPSGPLSPAVLFYDINVAFGPRQIDDKQLITAMEAVKRTTPDIRVFNLSFDNLPIAVMPAVLRQQSLALAQDLDNFIFENDVIVVVSSGNSGGNGLQPSMPYPSHVDDANWSLGAFANSFNSVTCGAYVSMLSAGGLIQQVGWPSPFSRVGPGMNGSPKPDFAAPGGNSDASYACSAGMGVWGVTSLGNWNQRCGTSYAAPLFAREAALALRRLQSVCEPGQAPYAATAKAFLALTAERPDPFIPKDLAQRALGHGTATVQRLITPEQTSAVFVWQGLLEDKDDIARVQMPIPRAWILAASSPQLTVAVSADVPVDAAAAGVWASRRINLAVRPHPDLRALIGKRSTTNEAYPLFIKKYKLSGQKTKASPGDIWTFEISYDQIADYLPSMTFTSQQRVSIAVELFDAGDRSESPQADLQAMPFTQTMTSLSVANPASPVPVMLRTIV